MPPTVHGQTGQAHRIGESVSPSFPSFSFSPSLSLPLFLSPSPLIHLFFLFPTHQYIGLVLLALSFLLSFSFTGRLPLSFSDRVPRCFVSFPTNWTRLRRSSHWTCVPVLAYVCIHVGSPANHYAGRSGTTRHRARLLNFSFACCERTRERSVALILSSLILRSFLNCRFVSVWLMEIQPKGTEPVNYKHVINQNISLLWYMYA